jgi:hypothetical protein
MRTKVAFYNGAWTVFGSNKPVATFPSRKLAREYARELRNARSTEEFMKNELNIADEQRH